MFSVKDGWRVATNFASADINLLELFPIMLAVELWGPLLANHCVIFFTDNEVLVSVINKQSSHCTRIMKLVRQFTISCMKLNILFKAKHVAGIHNTVADNLSRFRFQEARILAPWLDDVQCPVPDHLYPEHWIA